MILSSKKNMLMDMKKLLPYLDKMKIVFKEPCKKWGWDRFHYGIKIWDEIFNYYGSNKEFTDEKRNYNNVRTPLPTDDDIKKSALYCLVNDYWTYEDYTMEDFIDDFWYKAKEWMQVYKELEINNSRMKNVFTNDELKILQELYEDY